MPDETPAGTTAPATPNAPPPNAAQPAADQNPAWLPDRLARSEEQGRTKLMQELGITDPAKAKAALDAAKKAEDDAKSAAQRLGETSTSLDAATKERDRYAAVVKGHADREMARLTDDQKAAVKRIAGDDAAAQLNAIDALAGTWAAAPPAAAPPPAQPGATPAPAPKPPPANTAPPPNAPPPATQSPTDHAAVHTDLVKRNPFEAADYGLAHYREVWPEKT